LQDIRLAEARKKMVKVVNWELMDERHRRLEDIDDTVRYLLTINSNVATHPDDMKYRKARAFVVCMCACCMWRLGSMLVSLYGWNSICIA
jgi:hypothetical protein